MNMSPTLFALNEADRAMVNAERCGNGAISALRAKDGARFGFGQFGASGAFSIERSIAALLVTISHVVCVRSKKKVRDVDAGRIVASVAYAHSSRDRAVFKLPRHAMGEDLSPVASETAISVCDGGAGPSSASCLIGSAVGDEIHLPVTVRHDGPRFPVSHFRALLWRLMVRAGTALNARFRPAFLPRNNATAQAGRTSTTSRLPPLE